jgi:GalNAc-alpha-(1->4)-GalNAc-alpha-(1->3)-diNAcBac-PP-undecaprenol alpha-1,4-N-acetyl-D-galactosaminyltransferase
MREPPLHRRSHPRVTLAISTLAAGGAERVLSRMANHWAEHDWSVTLVTLGPTTSDFYALHPAVERVGLDASRNSPTLWRALWSNAQRVKLLRRAIRTSRPDVVISFMAPTNVLTLLAARTEHVPVIVSERVDPTQYRLSPVWAGLRRLTYRWAEAVVVQTPEVRRWAEGFLAREAVHVIPNPVAAPPTGIRANDDAGDAGCESVKAGSRQVVAMGRLDAQKGFDLLVRAFAECCRERPDWRLTIIGEGEERSELEALASRLAVASRVRFHGRVAVPAAVLRGADLFVLSSRYEGFPNALLEAMAVGLPVIATDCPSGPAHIVRNGVDGILVPAEDVGALATAMADLMDDEARRTRLGERATSVTERFAIERIMENWESLVTRVTGTRVSAEA